jgi:Chaperone for flagella basal body P-ring formation
VTVQSFFARFVVGGVLAGVSFLLAGELAAEDVKDSDMKLASEPEPSETRQEVWRAVAGELRKQGMLDRQLPRIGDLDLPKLAPLEGQNLRVTSSCWDSGPRRTQFRLECSASGECLPFLVYFRDPANSDNVPAARARPCRVASLRPATGGLIQPTVRAGGRATAVFHGDGLRMTATVTCLERGREGEVIRVRAVDGHVFRARISGPGQLEALPQ